LLAKEADADAAPAAPGVNLTVKLTGVVGLTVTGKVRPVIENAEAFAPLKLTDVTVTLAPEAVSVPVLVALVPTVTLPTLTAVALKVPCAATPVPLRADVVGVLEALLAKEADADAAPAAPGVNLTVKLTGVVGVTVTGNVRPVTANSEPLVPLKLTDVTVTLAPEAVSVPVLVPLVPTVTLPTLTEVALKVP